MLNEILSELNEDELNTVIHKREILERTQMLLSGLSRSCLEATKVLSGPILDSERGPTTGLLSLPNELLELILLFAVAEDDCDTKLPVAISHVCKRFRDVALNIPHLWARVSIRQRPAGLSTFLSRRRNAKLTVVFIYSNADAMGAIWRGRNFLTELLPLCNDWAKVVIDSDYTPIAGHNQWAVLLQSFSVCRNMSANSLTDMVLRFSTDAIRDSSMLPIFFATWKMPILQRLELRNVIPNWAFPDSLKDVSIAFDEGLPLRTDQLLPFLSMNNILCSLSLDYVDGQISYTNRIMSVHFANLKHLRISSPPKSSIQNLLPKLHFPSIRTLSFNLYITPGLAITREVMSNLLPTFNDYTTLTEFSFKTRQYAPIDETPLNFLVHRFPSLQHLSIEAPNIWPPDGERLMQPLLHLKSISLKNCNYFDRYFMRKFAREMHSNGVMLDALSVSGCPQLSEVWLKDVFPSNHISSVD